MRLLQQSCPLSTGTFDCLVASKLLFGDGLKKVIILDKIFDIIIELLLVFLFQVFIVYEINVRAFLVNFAPCAESNGETIVAKKLLFKRLRSKKFFVRIVLFTLIVFYLVCKFCYPLCLIVPHKIISSFVKLLRQELFDEWVEGDKYVEEA